MKFTILLPHFKTFKMTAYTLSKLFQYRGNHEIEVIVIDNSPDHESGKQLRQMFKHVLFVDYPADNRMQSHGIAFDFVMPLVETEWFITVESDSFPTRAGWLDRYEAYIKSGFDGAGSLLKLSGGTYMHPAGALYKKSVWQEASDYCKTIEYAYLPNIAMKEGFPCHLMVSNRMFPDFSKDPGKYVKLDPSYEGATPLFISEKALYYEPTNHPFHNGMGQFQETFSTYAQRTVETEPAGIILSNEEDFIYRMGYEPGQWFCYYMLATGRELYYIHTDTVWIPGRVNQQQAYTVNTTGFVHLWGVSAYKDCSAEELQDIVKFKAKQVEDLYASL